MAKTQICSERPGMMTTTNNELPMCNRCNKTFRNKSNLSQHERRMHQPKKLLCICGKLFAISKDLTYHRKHCRKVLLESISAPVDSSSFTTFTLVNHPSLLKAVSPTRRRTFVPIAPSLVQKPDTSKVTPPPVPTLRCVGGLPIAPSLDSSTAGNLRVQTATASVQTDSVVRGRAKVRSKRKAQKSVATQCPPCSEQIPAMAEFGNTVYPSYLQRVDQHLLRSPNFHTAPGSNWAYHHNQAPLVSVAHASTYCDYPASPVAMEDASVNVSASNFLADGWTETSAFLASDSLMGTYSHIETQTDVRLDTPFDFPDFHGDDTLLQGLMTTETQTLPDLFCNLNEMETQTIFCSLDTACQT